MDKEYKTSSGHYFHCTLITLKLMLFFEEAQNMESGRWFSFPN